MKFPLLALSLFAVALAPSVACQSAYYSTMEAFGKAKREILVDRVKAARDEQTKAKEEFKDALTRFKEVTGFHGGDLEDKYEELKDEYDDCESRAKQVSSRIESIEDVSNAMFSEWKKELGSYTNQELRRSSERQLRTTKERYERLLDALKQAEGAMQPVLATFRDQVLFLKHNLNAQAISSLKTQTGAVEADVAKLIQEMEASIREADTFIEGLPKD